MTHAYNSRLTRRYIAVNEAGTGAVTFSFSKDAVIFDVLTGLVFLPFFLQV